MNCGGETRVVWAAFRYMGESWLGRGRRSVALPHQTHKAFVLSMRSAAGRERDIRGFGQSEGELRKRQKEADDQQQSAELTLPTSFVLLYACLQFAHAFMEAALFRPRANREAVT
jgi:hypothetical protein